MIVLVLFKTVYPFFNKEWNASCPIAFTGMMKYIFARIINRVDISSKFQQRPQYVDLFQTLIPDCEVNTISTKSILDLILCRVVL